MNTFKFYAVSVLLFTASSFSQATQILEIPVEDEAECNLTENIELFKKIEQEQHVEVKCVFINGHVYTEEIRVMAGRRSTPILDFFRRIHDFFTRKNETIEEDIQAPTEDTDVIQDDTPANDSEQSITPEVNPIGSLTTTDTTTQATTAESSTDQRVEYQDLKYQHLAYEPFNIDPHTPFTVVNTFFATDRAQDNTDYDPYKQFSNDIHQGESAYLLGRATVSIPKIKKPGVSTKPGFLTYHPDPSNHTTLWHNDIYTADEFFYSIQQNPNKKSFIFLHGYNVSFSKAAIQTAELTYDLKFMGTPIFYSWPSKAKLLGYFADQETLKSSQLKFADFLNEYLNKAPQELYLIAHSMGSQALLNTLEQQLPSNPKLRQHLKGIIFVAPDIPTAQFNAVLKKLSRFKIPVTLYGSQKDLALSLSQTISSQPRAGFLKPMDDMIKIKGLDVIDATEVQTDFLGHALSPMSTDISELMVEKIHAKLRSRLKIMLHKQGTYYLLKSD